MNQENNYFTNSTGETIIKLYKQLHHSIPGLSYNFHQEDDLKRKHSIFNYAKRITHFIFKIQIKHLLSFLTLKPLKNLQSKYSKDSLAILSNSIDLETSVCKSLEYNIPLMQIVIKTEIGEETVKEKILFNFNIAQFVNQNFVLYGDWTTYHQLNIEAGNKQRDEAVEQKQNDGDELRKQMFNPQECIYFRKGELVYAKIALKEIYEAQEKTFSENLMIVRDMFYHSDLLNGQSVFTQTESEVSPSNASSYDHDSRIFEPRVVEYGDNFIDSDIEP